VEPGHLADGLGGQTFQESAQTGLIWELIEPQHFQEGPVVLQDFGFVDAPKPHDDSEDQCQDEFGGIVIGAPLRDPHISLQQVADFELVAKTLNEPHPTKVCEMGFVERKKDFSGAFGHVTQSTPLGAFVSRRFLCPDYSFLLSENGRVA